MLVRQRRLFVQAGEMCYKLLRGGVLAFYGAFLPPGGYRRRLEALRDVCEELADSGPDSDALEAERRRCRRRQAERRYDAMGRLRGLMEAEVLRGDYRHYAQALEEVSAVSAERLRDVAGRLFAPQNTLELEIHPDSGHWWMPALGLAMRVIRR